MKDILKIQFADHHEGFDLEKNYFWDLLSAKYDLRLSNNPDILIYTGFGRFHVNFRCLKIYWTGENRRPDFNQCDFSFTFDEHSPDGKNYRLPLYAHYPHAYGLGDLSCITNRKLSSVEANEVRFQKTKFCNMVVSNARRDKKCEEFFLKLSKYKKVDSGGRYLNNIGRHVPDKLNFIKDYKFTMSFENASYPGYTTEKIIDPMFVRSIPIYWGNPKIATEFNPESFINLHDYASFDEAIRRIIQIDQNDELYNSMISAPCFHDDSVPYYLTDNAVLERFAEIIDGRNNYTPVSRTWRYYPQYLTAKLIDAGAIAIKNMRLRILKT
ncbi:MAG: glycosyltransferase family 10 [Smithella sp.]